MSKLTPSRVGSTFPNPRNVPGDGPINIAVPLSVETVVEAYRLGYYPKPDDDGTVRWWCTDPRTILYPDEFKASRSLKKSVRNRGYKVTVNKAFEDVISHCASRLPPKIRRCWASYESVQAGKFDWLKDLDQAGVCKTRYNAGILTVTFNSRWESLKYLGPPSTWITNEIISTYLELHQAGYAHSVETWWGDDYLAGGLYGISLGRMFFGDSMFSWETDASKVALFRLAEHLKQWNFDLIDCQEPTELLFSLGAREIPRHQFLSILDDSTKKKQPSGVWESI